MHSPFEADGTVLSGVFDMRHPISAVSLARVLLSLPHHLSSVASQAIYESNLSPLSIDAQLALSWRADQILPEFDAVSFPHQVISAWVESLPPFE